GHAVLGGGGAGRRVLCLSRLRFGTGRTGSAGSVALLAGRAVGVVVAGIIATVGSFFIVAGFVVAAAALVGVGLGLGGGRRIVAVAVACRAVVSAVGIVAGRVAAPAAATAPATAATPAAAVVTAA